MFRFLSYLFALLWVSLLTAAVVQSHRTPKWASSMAIKAGESPGAPPALFERLEQGLYKRNAPVVITQAELNRYLTNHLQANDVGPLAEYLKMAHFDIQCLDKGFDVRYAWRAQNGHLAAATMHFEVRREANQFLIEPVSGSYGRLPVPRGVMAPLLPALKSLAAAIKPELDLAFQMNQLKFEPGRIVLDPRVEAGR